MFFSRARFFIIPFSTLWFLACACAVYQAERDERELRQIENDILILNHAGAVLDTVYRGSRGRPNIIGSVEKAARGNENSRDQLAVQLRFIQDYLRKVPPLHSDIPEADQFQRSRARLLAVSSAEASIQIYRALRADIEHTVDALEKKKATFAGSARRARKFLATPGGTT